VSRRADTGEGPAANLQVLTNPLQIGYSFFTRKGVIWIYEVLWDRA
jgi:hypothetical protein